MKGLVFSPAYDTPPKLDVKTVFRPEARRFCELHSIDTRIEFDNQKPLPERFAFVMNALRQCKPGSLSVVSFFCHGWTRGIQAGPSIRKADMTTFAQVLASVVTDDVIIPLYCCSTAGDLPGLGPKSTLKGAGGPGGDGAFADQLRDALCAAGKTECQVFGHTVPGHATRLPYVRRFAGEGSPTGGQGGAWLIAPGSTLWAPWRKALQSPKSTLRLRFPLMSIADIHAELQGPQ